EQLTGAADLLGVIEFALPRGDIIRHFPERVACPPLPLATGRKRFVDACLGGVKHRLEEWILRDRLQCGADSYRARVDGIAVKVLLEDAGDLILVGKEGVGEEALGQSLRRLRPPGLGDSPLE